MISFRPDRSEFPSPAEDNLTFSERSRSELREQVDTFNRNAELKTRLQNTFPDWQPTEAHRFVVGVMRDIGARLHPMALKECPFPVTPGTAEEVSSTRPAERLGLVRRLEDLYRRVTTIWGGYEEAGNEASELKSEVRSPRSPEELALESRVLLLFARSLKNVARYSRSEPLEETIDGELRSIVCPPSSSRYQGEYLGSLWATQAALYAFRDNERLLGEIFQVMRRNLPDMLVIFSDENSFNQLMSTMQIVARRSETFKTFVLSERWLSLRESDRDNSTDSRLS